MVEVLTLLTAFQEEIYPFESKLYYCSAENTVHLDYKDQPVIAVWENNW